MNILLTSVGRRAYMVKYFQEALAGSGEVHVCNVEAVQSRQGFYVSCIEEIAWRRGFISNAQLKILGEKLKMTEYGQYLLSLTKEEAE